MQGYTGNTTLGYLPSDDFSGLMEGYNEVGKMLNGLINSLKERLLALEQGSLDL